MIHPASRELAGARRFESSHRGRRGGAPSARSCLSASVVLVLAVGALTSCGGSQKSAGSADGESGASTAGQKCLADADAQYKPRADAPNRIDVEHIVVRHAGLEDPQGATRTPEEACLRVLEAWKKLQGGAEWDAIVEEYSDAKGAAGGKLSRISADEVDSDFAAVAFSLEPDQLSYVVKTERGFHLILRTH